MGKSTKKATPKKAVAMKISAAAKRKPDKRKSAAAPVSAMAPMTVPTAGPPPGPQASATVLDRLWSVIMSRRNADPAISHSARLLSRGTAKIAQKFGEEAVECLIEAVAGTPDALIAESADVLYHLLVIWVNAGVRPEAVWDELLRREGISGIAEKASRARRTPSPPGPRTTKIP